MNKRAVNVYYFNFDEVAIYVDGAIWHWGIVGDDWWKTMRKQYPDEQLIVTFHNCDATLPRKMIYRESELKTGQ